VLGDLDAADVAAALKLPISFLRGRDRRLAALMSSAKGGSPAPLPARAPIPKSNYWFILARRKVRKSVAGGFVVGVRLS
jgi:hypothetical protein